MVFVIHFFISWRLIALQYCSSFCHTQTWISHGYTCIPHPDPPSHLPLHPIPLGLPSAPGPSTCLMHPTWAGDLFHAVLLKHPTLAFSHRVQKSVLPSYYLPATYVTPCISIKKNIMFLILCAQLAVIDDPHFLLPVGGCRGVICKFSYSILVDYLKYFHMEKLFLVHHLLILRESYNHICCAFTSFKYLCHL